MGTLDELLAEMVEVNCQRCQGHGSSMPGHGYCAACKGEAYVQKPRYFLLSDAQRVLVLEEEVMRLRPDLAAKRKPKE